MGYIRIVYGVLVTALLVISIYIIVVVFPILAERYENLSNIGAP